MRNTLAPFLLTIATITTGLAAVAGTGGTLASSAATTPQPTADRAVAANGAAPAAPAARAAGTSPSAGVLTLDWGDIDATHDAWRGNYVVLQPWEHARIRQLKARNPRVKVLMYKDVAAVRKDAHESGIYSTGLSYREAADNGWLMHDRHGHIIEWSDWRGLYPTNIADRAYQQRWGSKVLAELKRYRWDGVMMDDTLTRLSHTTVNNRQPVEIPNDQAMYRATESFLKTVAGRVRNAGFMAVPNVTVEWDNWDTTMRDWTRYVSGWENEYFVKWGLDRSGSRFVGPDWEWKVKMAEWLAARNVPLLAITYSNRADVAAQIYHRATWLLTWNGRTGSSIFVPDEANTNHWRPKATVSIGKPQGARREVGQGVWRRNYTKGTVLVNPTTTARTVTVGSGYRSLSGKPVSSVRVGALGGVILRHG